MLLGRRVAAYLVDVFLLFIVLAAAGYLIQRLLGVTMARTGPEVWRTILWSFSLPTWLYFILCDSSRTGATLGKQRLKIQVKTVTEERLSLGRAFGRNAIKLLPWELVHISAFALSAELAQLSPLQIGGLILANLLIVFYLVVTVMTKGQRSIHDFVAGTMVCQRSPQAYSAA